MPRGDSGLAKRDGEAATIRLRITFAHFLTPHRYHLHPINTSPSIMHTTPSSSPYQPGAQRLPRRRTVNQLADMPKMINKTTSTRELHLTVALGHLDLIARGPWAHGGLGV